MSSVLAELVGQVLVLRLNRPDRLNAIDTSMRTELGLAWAGAADPSVRAVVITGEGRGFCAGADLRESNGVIPPPAELTSPTGLRHTYNPDVLALVALPKPVIAAVNGVAAGAGLGIALAADLRIASPSATFVPSFIRAGVIPDMGVSSLAVRALGYTAAFEWLAGGRPWNAELALARGLVSAVAADDESVLELAIARAQVFAAFPATAVGLTKAVLQRAVHATLADQLEAEHRYQTTALADPERVAARASVVASIATTTGSEQSSTNTTEGGRPR